MLKFLSYSHICSFENCPYLFKRTYIDKAVPFITNKYMERGKLIHKFISEYLESGYSDKISEKYYTKIDILFRLENMVKKINKKTVVGIEKYIETKVSGMKILGYADLITENSIIDFKTGKSICDEKQLSFYNFILGNKYKCGYYIYVDMDKYGKVTLKTDIQQWIETNIDKIMNTKRFIPKKNRNCKYCKIKKECSYELTKIDNEKEWF